jgi:hypothetical protein
MVGARWERWSPLSGAIFAVLVIAGNLLQGATPPLHGDPSEAAAFYAGSPLMIALGMSLSLISLFFLAWFLSALRQALLLREGQPGTLSTLAFGGGLTALGLLAAGFSFNAAGALRAQNNTITADIAVVFYDGGAILMGLAATLALAIMLAATAVATHRFKVFRSWFGWLAAVLAVVGLLGPVAWLLLLLFPLWALTASILLLRGPAPA